MTDEKLKVLLVDDDPDVRLSLTERLERDPTLGVQVAASGEEALRLVHDAAGVLDVVLMDQVLEDMSGIETMRRLKADFPHIPVIMFTGEDYEAGVEALKQGAYRYILKPFDDEELIRLVHSVTEQETALEKAAAMVCQLLNIPTCIVWILNRTEGQFEVAAYLGNVSKEYRSHAYLKWEDDIIRQFFGEQSPKYLPDVRKSKIYKHKAEAIQARWVSLLTAPMLSEGRMVGIVDAYTLEPRTFSEQNKVLLRMVADQAAGAIRSAQLFDRSQALLEITQKITGTFEPQKILDLILQKGLDLVGTNIGWLYLLERGTNQLRIQSYLGIDADGAYSKREIGDGITGWVAKTGIPQNVPNVSKDNRYRHTRGPEVRSEVVVPLKRGQEVIGVLAAKSPFLDAFSEDDVFFLSTFASQATIALENARQHQELGTLYAMSREIVVEQQTGPVLYRTIQHATELLQARGGGVYVPVQGTAGLRLNAVYGLRPELEGTTLNFGEGMAGKVFLSGKPMRVADYRTWSERAKIFEPDEFTAVIEVPLKVKDRTLGVLFLADDVEQRTFTKEDEELLERLAYHASIAIHNASLLDQEQQRHAQRVQDMAALQEINGAIVYNPLDEIARLIVKKTVVLIGASYATLRFVDRSGEMLELAAVEGRPSKAEAIPVDGSTLSGWVAMTGQAVLCPDVKDCPQYVAWYEDVQSCMAVPLKYQGQTTGTLYVESLELGAFSEQHQLDFLQTLADQTAIAVEVARSHDRRAEDVAALRDINSAVASQDLQAVLQLIVDKAAEAMPGEYSSLWLKEQDTDSLLLQAMHKPDPALVRDVNNRIEATASGNCQLVVNSGKPIIRANVTEIEQAGHFVRIYIPAASSLTVPLVYRGEIIGALNVESAKPAAFSEANSQLLSGFADQAAVAIQNARYFQELEERAAQLGQLQQVMATITSEPSNLNEVLNRIVKGLEDIFHGASSAIRLYDPATGEFEPQVAVGVMEKWIDQPPRTDGTSYYVVSSRKPRYLNSGELTSPRDGGPSIRESIRDLGVHAVAYLPLLSRGKVVGILYVNMTDEHRFSNNDRLILELFADQASIAIETAGLFGQWETLHRASLEVSSKIELDAVLRSIARQVRTLLDADAATIFPYNYETGEFQEGVREGEIEEALSRPTDTGLASRVIQHTAPIYKSEKEVTAEVPVVIDGKPVRSYAGIPLRVEDGPVGILFINFFQDHVFSEDEKNLSRLFALQAATAINNARLFSQLEERADQLLQLQQVTSAISAQTGREMDTLQLIVDSVSRLFPVASTAIRLYDKTTDSFPARVGTSGLEELMDVSPRPDGISRYVLSNSAAYYLEGEDLHLPDGAVPALRGDLQDLGVKAMAVLPLRRSTNVVGLLYVGTTTNYRFSENDRQLLDLFANQASVALENARLSHQAQALRELSQAMTSELELTPLLQMILERGLELIGCRQGSIGLVDMRTDQIVFDYTHGMERYRIGFGEGLTGEAAATRKPVRVADVREHLHQYKEHIPGTRSELDVPLMIGNEVIGVLNAESPDLDAFTEDDEQLFMALAAQAAIAINNARQYQQRIKDIASLQEINTAIGTQELEDVFELIAQAANDLTEATYSTLWTLDRENHCLRIGAVSGRGQVSETLPLNDKSINGFVARTGVPYLCPHVRLDPHYVEWFDDIRSNLTVALRFRGEVIGTLHAESDRVNAFTEYQCELLQSLGDQAAIAIENARLIAQLQEQRRREIEAVKKIASSITAKTVLKDVLAGILDSTISLIGGSVWGEVRLLDRDTHELVFESSGGRKIAEQYPRIKIGEGIIGQAAQQRKTLVVGDVHEHDGYIPFLDDVRSEVAVPMLEGDVLVGVFNMEHTEVNAFSRQDVALIEAVAGLTVVAIANARLYQERERKIVELEVLTDIGRTVSTLGTDQIVDLVYEQMGRILDLGDAQVQFAFFDASKDLVTFPLAMEQDGDLVIDVIRWGTREEKYRKPDESGLVEPFQPRSRGGRFGLTEYVIHTGQPVLIPDDFMHKVRELRIGRSRVKVLPKFGKLQRPTHSWLGVPMIVGGRVTGLISIQSLEMEHAFDEGQIVLLSAVANQAAVAIENARLLEDREKLYEQRVSDIAALQEINEAVAKEDRDIVLQMIVDKTVEVMPGEYSSLWLKESEAGDLLLQTMHGPADRIVQVGKISADEENICQQAVTTGKPIIRKDVSRDSRPFTRIYQDANSSVTVPLIYRDGRMGALNVESSELAAFTNQHADLLTSFAHQAAIAIENSRLYRHISQNLERRIVELEVLTDIGRTVSTLGIDQIVDLVYEQMGKIIDLREAQVQFAFFDEAKDQVTFPLAVEQDGGQVIDIVHWGTREEQYRGLGESESVEPFQPRSRGGRFGLTEYVIHAGEPVLIPDNFMRRAQKLRIGDSNVRVLPTFGRLERPTHSWLGVPMMVGGRVTGLISIQSLEMEHAFDKDQIELLTALANQAAVAIENARLYHQLKAAQTKIAEKESALVRTSLATDIVHRINNLAGTTPLWIDLIEERLLTNMEVGEFLDKIRRDFYDLLRVAAELDKSPTPEIINLAFLLETMSRSAKTQYYTTLDFSTDIEPGLYEICAIPVEIRNAIWNVVLNGIEAMQFRGTLTIRCRNFVDEKRKAWVRIQVEDTGLGIPDDQLGLIFDLSYTTKEEGRGYGLWRTKDVIEGLGGTISVSSEIGIGSTFCIILPAAS